MRRTYGTGSIEERGGKHRIRVCAGGKRTTLATVATREEAESTLRGFVALAAAGEVNAAGDTLRSWGPAWLDSREAEGSANVKSDRSRWDLHIATAPFYDWPLANVRRRDIRAWLAKLATKLVAAPKKKPSAKVSRPRRPTRRLGWQSRKHCLNLLRKCLAAAVDDELLEVNPAAGVGMPPRPADDDEIWTYLTPEEQGRLLTCELIPRMERMLIAFAIGTGLRQSELYNLELRDLHVKGDEPHVYVRWGKKGKLPKNGKRRTVPLFGLALRAAETWLAELPRYAPQNPHKLAFPTRRGCRRRDSKAPLGWASWLVAAGLKPEQRHDGRGVRWHDLRHTCASSLVAGWWRRKWPLAEVRDMLGHKSVAVTERYAHLAPSVLAEAAAATPGAMDCPTIAPALPPPASETLRNKGRATVDSNHWPSAPEAAPVANDVQHIAPLGGSVGANLRPLAERYVRAVASRNRFAHRYGLELAEAVLEVTRASVEEAAHEQPKGRIA